MRLRLPLFALLAVLAALVLAACGESGAGSGNAGDPASVAPPGTPIYLEATVHPKGAQKQNATQALRTVLRTSDPGGAIVKLLDKTLSKDNPGLSFRRDVEPWLGDRVGVAVTSVAQSRPEAAVIVAATDTGKAADALAKAREKGARARTYHGVTYHVEPDGDADAIVSGFAVGGDEGAVRQVIAASKGASLADADRFDRARSRASADRLGLVYVDLQRVLATAGSGVPAQAQGILSALLGDVAREPIVVTISAQPNAFVAETRLPAGGSAGLLGFLAGKTTPLLGALPADAWLALGIPDLGTTIEHVLAATSNLGIPGVGPELLKQQLRAQTGFDLDRDLLSWVGDAALYVRGTTRATLGGALVLGSKDPAASRRAAPRIAALVRRFASSEPIRVVAQGDRVVVGYGAAATRQALSPARRLDASSAYAQAKTSLGSGFQPTGLVRVPPILALADALGAGKDSRYRDARPYLATFGNLVFGSRKDGDQVVARAVLGLR